MLYSVSCIAQESSRPSLAGSEVAADNREARLRMADPTVEFGPTKWEFNTALGLQASDNIRLESKDPKADLVFYPELQGILLWRISENKALNFNLSTGYSAYWNHAEYDHFYIGPGSKLDFEFYLGDFYINLHDRVLMLENSYEDPTVVGSADYTRIENTLGQRTVWDLNKAVLTLAYDHVNYFSFSGSQPIGAMPDAVSDSIAATAGYRPAAEFLVGLATTTATVEYSGSNLGHAFADALQWTIGPFLDLQMTRYLCCHASVGYLGYWPSGNEAAEHLQGVSAQVELDHGLNRFVDYALAGGRNISFALYGGTIDLVYAQLRASWHFIHKINLTTFFTYEHGSAVGPGGEMFDRYGPGIRLERMLTQRLTASLEYQFFSRASNQVDRSYTTNILAARLKYDF